MAFSLFLAALLLVAAAHKARTFGEFVGVVANYRIAPIAAARILAPLIIVVEALIAICLLAAVLRAPAAIAAAILFSFYGALIAFNLARGNADIDCGCSFGGSADRLDWSLVVRNAMLTAMALTVAAPGSSRVLGIFDAVTISLCFVGAGLIYLSAEALRANRMKFIAAGYR